MARRWCVFSDRVMGGVSSGRANYDVFAGAAVLPVTPTWQSVSLLWRAFTPASLRAPLDSSTLQRIGIVAGTTAFDAAAAISRLELVP